jgi:FtsP/CotA-like multicopper oxidase with cupredoxin domain
LNDMTNRRNFLSGAGAITGAIAAASVSKVAMAALPEPVLQTTPNTMPPLVPSSGRPYNPVVTLNGWTLPWRMNNGVKEFHLVAEPVVREMAPGFKANLWGYNGQSPGPTIEVVEGDRVRIFVWVVHPRDPSVPLIASTATSSSCSTPSTSRPALMCDAQGQYDARLQSVDLEQPRLPRNRPFRSSPGTTRCRIRFGNLTMTNHPIHMHGL